MARGLSPHNRMLTLLESLEFSVAAANALVDKQLLISWSTLWELDANGVANLCKTVCKQGSGEDGHQIPKMAVTQL